MIKKRRFINQSYELTEEKYLTENEQAKLLKNIEAMWDIHPRNAAFILTALWTGARVKEIRRIRKRDLLSKQQVRIFGLKGSNNRNIPVKEKLYDRLKELSILLKQEDYIFDFGYTQARNIWCQFRPVDKKFHSLRHSFAYNVFKKTKDPYFIQKCLGHRDFNCSLIYMKFQYDQEKMATLLLD